MIILSILQKFFKFHINIIKYFPIENITTQPVQIYLPCEFSKVVDYYITDRTKHISFDFVIL